MACEKCWGDAWIRSQWNGKSQSENYQDLLEERRENPCTEAEQLGQFEPPTSDTSQGAGR